MENKQIHWLYRFTEQKAKVEKLGFQVDVKNHAIALRKNDPFKDTNKGQFFYSFFSIEEFVGFTEALECLTDEGENLASYLKLQKTS
jgi:hypothetical protein